VTDSRTTATGGRASVRRFFVSVALVAATILPATALATIDDPEPQRTVTVREEHGVYFVAARFQVKQALGIALAVLTDYEQIPRFMPNVQSSIVLERSSGRAVVQQQGISRMMMFSKRVYLVLEITEKPDTLRFRDRSGTSFARYEGMWTLCEENGGTEIQYELAAQPSFGVPEFLLKRLLRRDSGEMIDALKRAIAAR